MKNLIILFCMSLCFTTINAQERATDNYLDRHPIYDFAERQLNNTDTIPDFNSKKQKLKVTGIVYESDGVTPAKGVILYFEQADEFGDFDLRKLNDKRYVHHRSWIKTDSDGRYTLYTFVPGNDRRYNMLQQLHPSVKVPNQEAYDIASFVFDDDPLLTKRCRKRMSKKGDVTRILKLKEVDGLLVGLRDIILEDKTQLSQ